MAEAYTVRYDLANYHAAMPSGHEQQRVQEGRVQEIEHNLMRYVAEYRLGVKFDQFFYRTETDTAGATYLAGKEPGPIRNVFAKAIAARRTERASTRREEAELTGWIRLEQALLQSPDETMFVWVSPPGTEAEGYGGYSFTFVGQKERDPETGESRVRVIPYRNTLTMEEHRRYLGELIGESVTAYTQDTDFLLHPAIIAPRENLVSPGDVLRIIGEQEAVDISWNKRLQQIIGPLVQGYLYLVRNNASEQALQQALYAIENVVIATKTDILLGEDRDWDKKLALYEVLPAAQVFAQWGSTKPQLVGGSCGSTDGGSASTLMDFHKMFGEDEYGGLSFKCPHCGFENVREKHKLITNCQNPNCQKDVRC